MEESKQGAAEVFALQVTIAEGIVSAGEEFGIFRLGLGNDIADCRSGFLYLGNSRMDYPRRDSIIQIGVL